MGPEHELRAHLPFHSGHVLLGSGILWRRHADSGAIASQHDPGQHVKNVSGESPIQCKLERIYVQKFCLGLSLSKGQALGAVLCPSVKADSLPPDARAQAHVMQFLCNV